ncbi:tol-pal system protein YbgF [Nitrospirillum iridis]|uniref:Cell division coordinator CpoB n=1 Tax=Nitrospirillum iridis TaxID=765888 RepID=A0A7X0ED39_9PROT|nr:tol-pal system protein YbgF [Nitrospirillum iridis]MBB6249944.1 tol-pal system protein YbgF [Nitrospirillum iridis]
MTPSLTSLTSPHLPRRNIRWRGWAAVCAMAMVVAAPLLMPTPAGAQSRDMQDLLNRLSRLETDVQTLSRDVYRNGVKPTGPMTGVPGGGGSAAAGELEVLKLQMETQTQQQTGKYEELAYQVSQIKERLDKLSADIDLRLQKLEDKAGIGLGASMNGGGADAGGSPPADLKGGARPLPPAADTGAVSGPASGGAKGPAISAAPADAGGPLPAGPAQDQYDYAFNLLRQGDAPNAEKAFSQFLKQNPDNPLAANAQYWLGETFYIRGNFKAAAVAFGDGYKKYPKSNKGADYLLKLAMSLDSLGDRPSACVVLKQLDADKDAAPTVKRRGEDQKNRLGCK